MAYKCSSSLMADQTALIKSELFFPGTVLFGKDYTLWWGMRVYSVNCTQESLLTVFGERYRVLEIKFRLGTCKANVLLLYYFSNQILFKDHCNILPHMIPNLNSLGKQKLPDRKTPLVFTIIPNTSALITS